MAKHSMLGSVKTLSAVEKDSDQLNYHNLNRPMATDQLSTLFTVMGDETIGEVAGMKRNVEPTKQKNSEDAVEMGAAEEIDASTEETEKEIDLTPGALSRIDDPVRLYLNEMAGVSLLTREGEIELAKRIEDGKYELALAIAGMPMTLMYLDALRLAMKKGELSVRDLVLVNEATDEEELEEEDVEDEQDEEELLRRTLAGLEKLRRSGKSLLTLYAKRRRATQTQFSKIAKQVHNIQQKIVTQKVIAKMTSMSLNILIFV